MTPTTALSPSAAKPKRAASQRTERVIAESVTTTLEDPRFAEIESRLSGQFTNEVRTLEKHISEGQGAQITAYEHVMTTVGTLTTAVTNLTKQVEQLVQDRAADAAFIATKRTEDAEKAHQAELDAVAAKTRADIVLEQQATKEKADKEAETKEKALQLARKAKADRRNRLLTMLLTTTFSLIVVMVGYLVTGSGSQTGTSRVTVGLFIGFLFLLALGLAFLIKPPESVP